MPTEDDMLRDNKEDGFSPGSMLHLWTAQTDAVLIVRYLCACHVLLQGRPESEERKKGSVGRCTVSSGCGTPDCGWIETASDNFLAAAFPFIFLGILPCCVDIFGLFSIILGDLMT